jgi:perosamine synthetase
MKKKLVVEGGERILFTDFDSPDPVPEMAFKSVITVLATNKLWRYQHHCLEDSQVSLLEKEIADFCGAKYALAVSSCSAAMYIGLLCVGVKHGDKVLTSGFTFVAVPSTIIQIGAIPVLIETTENYCLDIEDLKKKIVDNRDAKVLLLSHMRGHISQMDQIVDICKENNIFLIEDCAHSLGCKWDGKFTGTFGKIGCFSFQSYKIINAGEGGVFITDDEDIFAKSIFYSGAFEDKWKHHIIKSSLIQNYQNNLPIYNHRMSEITAAIARPQIKMIKEKIKKYNESYNLMKNILEESLFINIPDRYDQASTAPDTIQFKLLNFSREDIETLIGVLGLEGVEMKYFGTDKNVRFYKNWGFLSSIPDLPKTLEILSSTCEVRLPYIISQDEVQLMGDIIIQAVNYVQITGRRKLKPQKMIESQSY